MAKICVETILINVSYSFNSERVMERFPTINISALKDVGNEFAIL